MYPHFYPYCGPTITELALSRENAILSTEVTLLQSQNRRLKTQIISRKYLDAPNQTTSIGTHKYTSSYRNKQFGTPSRLHSHRYHSQKKYPQISNRQERASRSIKMETTNGYSQRAKTPNQKQSKFYYDIGDRDRKLEENKIGVSETIIERLKSEDFRINPERPSHYQTNIKQTIHEDPQEQSSIQEYQPLQANKKTNIIYMMKSGNNNRHTPGARLSRISKKAQTIKQSGQKPSKKKYLQITAQTLNMIDNTRSKKA